jgi:hypothetical protein
MLSDVNQSKKLKIFVDKNTYKKYNASFIPDISTRDFFYTFVENRFGEMDKKLKNGLL